MDPFIGQIILFAGNFAPRGWAFCDGQLLSIAQNQALFSLLGTMYGGDGRTTFGLPDLRGRAAMHAGQGPGLSNYRQGQKGGVETVTLTTAEVPSHNHLAGATSVAGNQGSPVDHILGSEAAQAADVYSSAAANGTMNPAMIQNAGGGGAHNNVQPYLTLQYIIALVGTYPSRS